MTDFESRQQEDYRALRALYNLTVEQKQPGQQPLPHLDEILERSGLARDNALEAMARLVRQGYAADETFGPTYSITPEGEKEIEDILEAEANTARIDAAGEHQPLVMDVGLVLALLDYAAKYARQGFPILVPSVEGFSDEVIQYHVKNMRDEGLVDAVRMLSGAWRLQPLPWKGDRFRQAAKDDTKLKRVLSQMGELTGKLAPSALGALVSRLLAGS